MKFLQQIGDNIVELALISLIALFLWGIGYLILNDIEKSSVRYETCIAVDKQWIEGNCLK